MTRLDCMCSRFSPVTEAAALAAAEWIGKGDGLAGVLAARRAMSDVLASIPFCGRVAAGRGADDLGGALGQGGVTGAAIGAACEGTAEAEAAALEDQMWDLALAPLEGHGVLARGLDGALSLMAVGPAGSLMQVPEMYMQKLVVSGQAAGAIDIDVPVGQNIMNVAEALDRRPDDLTVAVLNRPRHEELIEEIKESGARLKLMDDGDLSAGISAAAKDSDVDICIGIGGSTEGIITAAAMRCLGGEIQARFWPVSRRQVDTIKKMGIDDVEATLTSKDMAGEGVLVAATAVTRGRFLRGVEKGFDGVRTETLVMCSECHKIEMVRTIHRGPDTPFPVGLWTP